MEPVSYIHCLLFWLVTDIVKYFLLYFNTKIIRAYYHTEKLTCLLILWMAIFVEFILFTTPSARAGYDTRSIFKWSLTGLKSEFSFSKTSCLTKAEESSLSYYLPMAERRIIGFIPFPRVLVLCEMQSVSYRIWTRVAVSTSYDDNHYTTGTSLLNLYNSEVRLLFWSCYVEECTDTDFRIEHGSVANKHNCWNGYTIHTEVHVTRSGGYINGSDRGLTLLRIQNRCEI